MELIIAKKQRQLSKFHCREMLYDYLKGEFDSERHKAVQDFLSTDEDLQEEAERLKLALSYCQDLGRAQLATELREELSQAKPSMSEWLQSLAWGRLPERAKWVLEASIIAMLVAVFSIYVPWKRLFEILPQDRSTPMVTLEEAVLTKDSNVETKDNPEVRVSGGVEISEGQPAVELSEVVASNSEKLATSPSAAPSSEIKTTPETQVDSKAQMTAQENGPPGTPVVVTAPSPQAQVVESKDKAISETEIAAEPKEETLKKKSILVGEKKALKGELYRVFMKLDNIDKNTDEFREKILSLGGEKAGEVQIGWRKPDGSYFHFSMDEASLENLKQFISAYGPAKFYKDPHWRVMPEGKIRIILWIEDSEFKK